MIDVRELRVGNLLNKEGIVVTIDARSIFDIWEKSDKYEPIPLTEEWLKRFKFHRQAEDRFYIFFKGRVLFDYWLNQGSIIIEGTFMPFKIQYVHQLQNLFYALTGEELKCK